MILSEGPAAAAAKSLQSFLTLCNLVDGSPPGSPVPGILQARTLEWVAISFSNAWKWKLKVKSLSHVQLLATLWTAAYQAPPSMGLSRQEYWRGVPLPSPWRSWGRIKHSNPPVVFLTLGCSSEPLLLLSSCSVVSDSLWPHGLKHARLPCPSPSSGVCSNSCLLSQWCHPTISSSAIPFSSFPQSFPRSRSFPMSQLFASGGQRIGASVSASVLPMNIQGWFPLGLNHRLKKKIWITSFSVFWKMIHNEGHFRCLGERLMTLQWVSWIRPSVWLFRHNYLWLREAVSLEDQHPDRSQIRKPLFWFGDHPILSFYLQPAWQS